MRSKDRIIYVKVNKQVLHNLPGYINLIHRHFEKESPSLVSGVKQGTFSGPIDLMRMTIPASLLEDVEEITLGYQK